MLLPLGACAGKAAGVLMAWHTPTPSPGAALWWCLARVQEALALVGWAAAILRQLDVESTKKAVAKLLECQVGRPLQHACPAWPATCLLCLGCGCGCCMR